MIGRRSIWRLYAMIRPPLRARSTGGRRELVHALGVDVALVVDAQRVLRQVLGRLAPDLLAAGLGVEARIVAGQLKVRSSAL